MDNLHAPALRHFCARWALLRPRFASYRNVRLIKRERLPARVRDALASDSPVLEPYSSLAKSWDEHAGTAPGYGTYARFLINARLIGTDAALDLACGTGITTAALAALFKNVHALDRSASMLSAARGLLGCVSNVEWIEGDYRDFTFRRSFDLVTCSGDSLNYAQSIEELASVFVCVSRVLSRPGVFVFDLQSEPPEFLNRVAIWHADDTGGWYRVHSYDPSTRIDCARAVWPFGVEHHRRRIFTRDEVTSAGERAGLVPADRFDTPLLRILAGSQGRDFYAMKRAQ